MTKEEYDQKNFKLFKEMEVLEEEYRKNREALIFQAMSVHSEYIRTNQQYCIDCNKPIFWCETHHRWWGSECECGEHLKDCGCKIALTSS